MTNLLNNEPQTSPTELEYLCVDQFMQTIVKARSLAAAFELGLIDYLVEENVSTFESLQARMKLPLRSLRLLLDLLAANHVVAKVQGEVYLTRQFQKALAFRDLLQVKLKFANYVAPDFCELFNDLLVSPEQFARQARIFDLFNYGNAFESTPESYSATLRWMRITTTLTKYEALVCLQHHDFSSYRSILDIGGNSGEFVLRICKKYPGMHATVFDLPVVCDVGLEHIRSEPEADRITFIKGDALRDELPKGFDLISFKSMLHDWPEKEARQFIAIAAKSLQPGGTLLIFERGPIEIDDAQLPYSMIPFLLFFHSFRSPAMYEEQLKDLRFQDIKREKVDLETPFYLITARKPLDQP